MALVDGAELGVVSGEIAFQIPLFANGAADTGFTTLVPEVHGDLGLHSIAPNSWRTTQAIPANNVTGNNTAYAADDTATLAEFEAALGTDYEILAFGAYLPLTKSAVVSHITWAGNTHWFLPAPTATITPASISKTDASDTGVTGVFTGFVPNESVEIGLGTGFSGGAIDMTTADANGVVTYTLVLDADPGLGTYTLSAFGASGVSAFAEFEVVADALPPTGVEAAPVMFAGAALILLGAGFVVFTRRRRAGASR